MSCLCIGGVCIPYSALLPCLLIGLQWIASQFAKVGLLPDFVAKLLRMQNVKKEDSCDTKGCCGSSSKRSESVITTATSNTAISDEEVIALVANPTSSSNASSKTASQNDIEHHQQKQQQGQDEGSNKQHLGFRHDYNLGDTARSSSHMIIETDTQRAIQSIGTLSSHDFAFVKRSDGTYTFSILAYRSSSTHVDEESLITRPPQLQQGEEVEESMTFVLSNAGCTKIIKKSQWSQCIRLVASEEEEDGTAQSLPVTVLQPDKTATAAKDADDEEVREVQSNPDVEIYLKKIRDQSFNTTQEEKKEPLQPGDPGWKPPDTLAFNTNMDDDLISCISTPMGLTREADDGQEKKTLSTQPVIEE